MGVFGGADILVLDSENWDIDRTLLYRVVVQILAKPSLDL